MADLVTIPAAELEALHARIARLSRDKAHFALVNELISRLGSVTGLENVVAHILSTLMNTIGGSNLLLYYRIDGDLFVADVYGRRERISEISDPQVREALETGSFMDFGGSAPRDGILTDSRRAGDVWIFPLKAGDELIGVFKMEGILLDGAAMRSQLRSVFHYAAMTLRGEIQSHSHLRSAYEALRHSEERFRSVVDTAHDGILLVDGKGDIVFWNAAAETIFGYPAAEIVGRPLSVIVPGETRERHRDAISRQGRGGEKAPPGNVVPVDGIRADGSPVPLELSLATWSGGGEPFCTVVVRDIRPRREAEEALRSSEEQLRQAMKMEAVGRLAGGIAHDFNNLLTVITGYSEMALRRLPPASPAFGEIEEIRRAGTRAAALTQQLLAFSRRQVVQPGPVDLNRTVGGMAGMLQRLIGEDVLLTVSLSDSPCVVMADEGQVEQVVANMAVNARDAMPDGGTLEIRTARMEPDAGFLLRHPTAMPVTHAVLTVADSGSGMDAETQAHLFDPFFTTKPVGKGTGLGLSTVYGIVAQGGGHIEVRSEKGRGSVFTVFLPLVGDAVGGEAAGAEDGMPGGGETILFVEDEAAVRSLVREILEELGYDVIEAGNGVEALELFKGRQGAIDLLMTDVVMPRMNGRELARQVLALSPGTRLLFISGYTDHDSVQAGALPPGAFFLQKPFAPDVLARKVRETLDSRPRSGKRPGM